MGIGFDLNTEATNTEVYGSLVYTATDDTPILRAAGATSRTASISKMSPGYKKAMDNLSSKLRLGIHAFPHVSDSSLLNVSVVGNILFNNGMLGDRPPRTDLLVGGDAVAISPVINANATYKAAPGNLWNNRFGLSAGCTNPTVTNNYFVGTTAWTKCTSGLILAGNTFYGLTYSQTTYGAPVTALDVKAFPNNAYTTTRPTGARVLVRKNQYEAGRANIAVYNWDRKSFIDVDLGSIVPRGAVYEVRNAQDYFGAPVVAAVYSGGLVRIPLTGLSVASPNGILAPLLPDRTSTPSS